MRNVHGALSSWQKQEEMKDTSYGGEGKGIFRSARPWPFLEDFLPPPNIKVVAAFSFLIDHLSPVL